MSHKSTASHAKKKFPDQPMKFCTGCNQTKPDSDFYKTPAGRPRYICKDCTQAATKQYRAIHGDRTQAERFQRWRRRHPVEAREIARVAMQHWRDGQRNLGQAAFDFLSNAQGRKKARANPTPQNFATSRAAIAPPSRDDSDVKCSQPTASRSRKSNPTAK